MPEDLASMGVNPYINKQEIKEKLQRILKIAFKPSPYNLIPDIIHLKWLRELRWMVEKINSQKFGKIRIITL